MAIGTRSKDVSPSSSRSFSPLVRASGCERIATRGWVPVLVAVCPRTWLVWQSGTSNEPVPILTWGTPSGILGDKVGCPRHAHVSISVTRLASVWKLRFGGCFWGISRRDSNAFRGLTISLRSADSFHGHIKLMESACAGGRFVRLFGDPHMRPRKGESFAARFRHPVQVAVRACDLFYGVGGCGVDQIYPLLKSPLDHFEDHLVVVGFMTFDFDRKFLSPWTGQKPRSISRVGQLELTNVPIEADPAEWFDGNPPSIRSYRAAAMTQQARAHLPKLMSDSKVEGSSSDAA